MGGCFFFPPSGMNGAVDQLGRRNDREHKRRSLIGLWEPLFGPCDPINILRGAELEVY